VLRSVVDRQRKLAGARRKAVLGLGPLLRHAGGKRGRRGTSPAAEGSGRTEEMAGRRGAVAAAVDVRWGWCSSRGGWKMRVRIGVGDGGVLKEPFIGLRRE
jgi:hypothetical protein